MVSFPRDIARFPLSNGKTFVGKINGLMTYANEPQEGIPRRRPPDPRGRSSGSSSACRSTTTRRSTSTGFSKMIDRVGGVTIDNPKAINDPVYGGWTDGRHRLPSARRASTSSTDRTALAYVRSRKGIGDSDFSRARRQQQLLIALEEKLTDPAMLPKLPDILDDAKDTLDHELPARPARATCSRSPSRSTRRTSPARSSTRRIRTDPPLNTTGGIYILKLDMKRAGQAVGRPVRRRQPLLRAAGRQARHRRHRSRP